MRNKAQYLEATTLTDAPDLRLVQDQTMPQPGLCSAFLLYGDYHVLFYSSSSALELLVTKAMT